MGSRVGGEVYGEWKLWGIVEQENHIMGKCRVGGEVHGKWKLLGIGT